MEMREKLYQYMKENNLGQSTLASMLSVSSSVISTYFKGVYPAPEKMDERVQWQVHETASTIHHSIQHSTNMLSLSAESRVAAYIFPGKSIAHKL